LHKIKYALLDERQRVKELRVICDIGRECSNPTPHPHGGLIPILPM